MSNVVRILRRAREDVDLIYEWLVQHSPKGAVAWYAAFIAAADSLVHDADASPITFEATNFGIDVRSRLFRTRRGRRYRLLYVITNGDVRILRVRGPGQPPVRIEDLRD